MGVTDTVEPDQQRRRRTLVGATAVVIIGLAVTAWAWWDGRGFDVGDTVGVTAEVVACGSIRVLTDDAEWQSESQQVRSAAEGTTELGTLRRRSTNEATYTSDLDGLTVDMQRIRSDLFWTLGCSIAAP